MHWPAPSAARVRRTVASRNCKRVSWTPPNPRTPHGALGLFGRCAKQYPRSRSRARQCSERSNLLRCLNRDPDLSLHRHRGISESRSASMPNCWQTIMRPSATASSPTTAEKLAPMATPSSPLSPHPRPAWRRRSKCSTCSPDTRGLVRSARACAGPKCEHRPTG